MSATTAFPAKRAVLHRMVTPDHTCPYGLKAKDLLERSGFEVEDDSLTTRAATDAFKAEHGVATTPQVFIGASASADMTTSAGSSVSAWPDRGRQVTGR